MTEKLTPEDAANLAVAVRKIAKAVDEVNAAGLSRRALVVLLDDATQGVSRRDINAVLNGLDELGKLYLDKAEAKVP